MNRAAPPPELSELSLLLPTWQVQKLAELAQQRGMNVGQLLRGLIRQVAGPRSEKLEAGV